MNASHEPERIPASPPDPAIEAAPNLQREEYIEQSHFFGVLRERLAGEETAQEVLAAVREELLATSKLPLAIDFLLAELRFHGVLAPGMAKLSHYFTPFQSFIIAQAEDDRRHFDMHIAFDVLRREADYRADGATPQGLFLYHLETLSRNRLSYDEGLEASATDPLFDARWKAWILTVRRQIGIVDIADLIYVRSEYYQQQFAAGSDERSQTDAAAAGDAPLFGVREGRIALANRRKDALFLFAALNRQLGYPEVPRPRPADRHEALLPSVARRVEQLESRIKLLEEELRGGIDLSKFYEPPPDAS